MPNMLGIKTQLLSQKTRDSWLSVVKTPSLYFTWAWIGNGSWRTDGQNYDR